MANGDSGNGNGKWAQTQLWNLMVAALSLLTAGVLAWTMDRLEKFEGVHETFAKKNEDLVARDSQLAERVVAIESNRYTVEHAKADRADAAARAELLRQELIVVIRTELASVMRQVWKNEEAVEKLREKADQRIESLRDRVNRIEIRGSSNDADEPDTHGDPLALDMYSEVWP